jgi:hypothetical protein
LIKARQVIADVKPDIVLSHEEFAAVVAAHMDGLPSIFMSAWLPPGNSLASDSLAYADSIVILGEPGIFPLPVPLKRPPLFVGSLVREMKFSVADRSHLRSEFDVPQDAFVILVNPGGWTEQQVPLAAIVLSAYTRLESSHKELFWLTSEDYGQLSQAASKHQNVRVLKFHNPIEQLIALSDVVVTKGTRGATLDAAAVGVPSISISAGLNQVDELLVTRIPGNTSLYRHAVDGNVLLQYLQRSQDLQSRRPFLQPLPPTESTVAGALLGEILRFTS